MFGIGGSEILVILVVALLFLGPDKLPEAAKQISKGIRDLKQQSRILQRQIENDETIGGAIRDLKSALNGDEAPARPPVRKQPVLADGKSTEAALESPDVTPEKMLTMPPTAGEPDPDGEPPPYDDNHDELGRLIRSPQGTVAKNAPAPAVATAETPAKAETPAPPEPAAATTATPTQKHG